MKLRRLLLGLAVLALALLGAKPDLIQPNPQDWTRLGSPIWSKRLPLASSGTTYPMNAKTSTAAAGVTTVPACFSWQTILSLSASAQATCCLVGSSTVTIGSQSQSHLATYVLDTKVQGQSDYGACVTLEGGAEHYRVMPRFNSTFGTGRPGARTGVCSGTASPLVDEAVVPLCRIDGDCTDAGVSAGTCSTTRNQANTDIARQRGCAFLVCRGLANNAQVTVSVER